MPARNTLVWSRDPEAWVVGTVVVVFGLLAILTVVTGIAALTNRVSPIPPDLLGGLFIVEVVLLVVAIVVSTLQRRRFRRQEPSDAPPDSEAK